MTRRRSAFVFAAFAFVAGVLAGGVLSPRVEGRAQATPRVFELRTYTTHEGKLEALHARFRNHTMRLFERHGMTNVAYWSPQDPPLAASTLIYILAHTSREAAAKSWDAFRKDPEWQKARAESEAAGPIVSRVESVFMDATAYSPMK